MSRIRPGKTISLLLSLAIVIGSMPITAFALDTVDVPTLPGGSSSEEVDVIITVTSNEETGAITTEKKTPDGGDTTDSSLNVNYEGSTVINGNHALVSDESHYTVSNSSGTYGAEGGSTTATDVPGDGSAGDINIGIIRDGEKAETEGSAESPLGGSFKGSTTVPTHEGDHLKSEDPANFDQTTITTETDRTATAEVTDPTVKVGDPIYLDENGNQIAPENYDGYYFWCVGGVDGGAYKTKYWDSLSMSNKFVTYLNTDDENDPKNGTILGGLYCVDMDTYVNTVDGYSIVNLEDAAAEGYYTEEEAAKLRAIMNHGFMLSGAYVGDNFKSDDSSATRASENQKTLDALKKDLRAALADETSQLSHYMNSDQIESLTIEQAMIATQTAIWSIANRHDEDDDDWFYWTAKGLQPSEEAGNAFYWYLLSLTEGATDVDGKSKESQLLSEDRFIDDMDIIIGGMVKADETDDESIKAANSDDDLSNDVYNVGLKFSLKVTPAANDDLIVKVLDSKGKVVKTARIAGENKEGETCDQLTADGGYYTLTGLQLAENSKTTFNLKLEGVQYLEEGVYVFQSRIATDADATDNDGNEKGKEYSTSQNLIGKYSGTADIDLSMQFDLTFNVDEGTVTTTREWRHEWTNSGGHHDDEEDGDDEEETQEDEDGGEELDIPDGETPQADIPVDSEVDIPDEEVPLASVPRTGDDSGLWLGLTALCACSLAALALTGRKREQA